MIIICTNLKYFKNIIHMLLFKSFLKHLENFNLLSEIRVEQNIIVRQYPYYHPSIRGLSTIGESTQ